MKRILKEPIPESEVMYLNSYSPGDKQIIAYKTEASVAILVVNQANKQAGFKYLDCLTNDRLYFECPTTRESIREALSYQKREVFIFNQQEFINWAYEHLNK